MARAPDIKSQDLGLKVLFPGPTDQDDVEADIVAVHGIGVNPKATWTHSTTRVNWLSHETMLPEALPQTRIMAFAYDSGWFGAKAVRQSLEDISKKLLRALGERREDCPHRPIVFIGHCFGGLVLQQAYLLSLLNSTDFPDIRHATRGMVFLGTPHHGVEGDSVFSTPGMVYAAIAAATPMEIQDNLLQTVARDNDILNSTVTNFTRHLNNMCTGAPKLFCFFEQMPTNIGRIISKDLPRTFMVSRTSASLTGHENEGLALDHFGINKFENAQDNHYQCVRTQIVKMVKSAQAFVESDTKVRTRALRSREIGPAAGLLRRHDRFAGRGNMTSTIDERLSKKNRVVLRGESGSGKTCIAVEYAHKFLEDHPGSQVLWANARTAEELRQSFLKMTKSVRVSKKDMGPDRIIAAVLKALKHDSNYQWLFVLDGLDNLDDLQSLAPGASSEALLATILPNCDDVKILVTTRDQALAHDIVKMKHNYVLSVNDLDPDDATLVLVGKATKDPGKRKWVEEVYKRIGFSAGALRLAQLGCRQTKRDQYLAKLKSEQVPPGAGAYSAWSVLFRMLQSQDSSAGDWLLRHSVLDVQMLHKALFPSREKEVLQTLRGWGMIEATADGSFYSIPALYRNCALIWLTKGSVRRPSVEAVALKGVVNRLTDDNEQHLLPVAITVSKFEPTSSTGKQEVEKVRERLARLSRRESHHSALVQPSLSRTSIQGYGLDPTPSDVVAPYRQHFEQLEQSDPGWNSANTLRAASRLAAVRLLQDSAPEAPTDAIALYSRAVDTVSSKSGVPSELARHQYNLALAYDIQHSFADAAKLYRSALRSAETGEPRDWELYFLIQSSLARLCAANNQRVEASETPEAVLLAQKERLPPNHPQVLATWRTHAMHLQEGGDLDAAEKELNGVLQAQLSSLGIDHPETLRTHCQLALLLARKGDMAKSELLYRTVLEKQEAVLGGTHCDTVLTRKMLEELRFGVHDAI